MRQSLAAVSNCPAALSVALLAVVMAPSSPDMALSDASGSGALTSAAPPTPACGSHELELHEPAPDSEPGCATAPRTPAEIAEARAYLIETASPGYTMMLQAQSSRSDVCIPNSPFAWRMQFGKRGAPGCRLQEFSQLIDRPHSELAVSPTSSTRCIPTDSRSTCAASAILAPQRHGCGTRSLPRTVSFVPMVLATTPNGIIASRRASRSSRPRTPCARR